MDHFTGVLQQKGVWVAKGFLFYFLAELGKSFSIDLVFDFFCQIHENSRFGACYLGRAKLCLINAFFQLLPVLSHMIHVQFFPWRGPQMLNLLECAECPRRQKTILRIVEKVRSRQYFFRVIQHRNKSQFPINAVQHVIRAAKLREKLVDRLSRPILIDVGVEGVQLLWRRRIVEGRLAKVLCIGFFARRFGIVHYLFIFAP